MKKEELKNIKEEFKKCHEKENEYLEGWKRAKADFLNYKKDEGKRNEELAKYIKEEIIFGILPILDNFKEAKNHIPKNLKDDEYVKGIFQIEKQFQNYLKEQGLEEIKSIGENFNPELHEAVDNVEKEKGESGKIVEEIRKGYRLKGRVLRPAKVKVIK